MCKTTSSINLRIEKLNDLLSSYMEAMIEPSMELVAPQNSDSYANNTCTFCPSLF